MRYYAQFTDIRLEFSSRWARGWLVLDRDIPDPPNYNETAICFCRNKHCANKIVAALNEYEKKRGRDKPAASSSPSSK